MDISSARSDYIILANNNISEKNIGTNLYIKTKIISLNNNVSHDISWLNILQNVNTNYNNYKNRIILCGKINDVSSSNACLITKNNMKNNMKFIFDSSYVNTGKILFVKNLQTSDNSLNHLFNNLKNTIFENNISNNIDNSNNTNIKRYIYHFNYYFSNSDIYKINVREYLYKYFIEISNNLVSLSNGISKDICYNTIGYTITNSFNDFTFINSTIDSSSVINFKSSNFSKLLIDNSGGRNFINTNDTSINTLVLGTNYSVYRNLWSYNKLTLDYKHVNYYNININNDFSFNRNRFVPISYINLPNNIIKTFLIKTNNISLLQNSKSASQIIFGLKNIYLNNLKVLDINSNLYYKQLYINNISGTLIDASNIIFLGLGNQLTGITQHHIYNHVHFSYNSSQKLIIKIKKNINTTNINTNSKFTSLIPSLNNYYLLDISLNYNSNNTNISHNINNTIKYNNILYNNVQSQVGKVFNLNFNSFFDALTNNYFKNSFNTLATLNNTHNLYLLSTLLVDRSINFKFKNIIKVPTSVKLVNQTTLLTTRIPRNSDSGYDLRFNYDSYFFISNNLDILLTREFLTLRNNYFLDYYEYSTSLLNFYSLTINNLVQTFGAGNYTDVECIYIYHDPINDPDERFRYPNNNIEIKFDTDIDTLTNAIEQYRSAASTSTTNAVFIPTKNGSNISKKMIQGLIGLNDVPKLLSIKPYDPNFINGRGFINQYQITDNCITSNCDTIARKQNAIKHESVKNNRINSSNSLKKQDFANIVKSNVRNRFSQECINNAVVTNNVATIGQTPDPNCIKIRKYTPFVLFEKGKGKYL
jgi:hypothetical protein